MDINLKLTDECVLNFRVAAILKNSDHKILIHQKRGDSFWTLPGGKVKFLEDSITAIKREIREELTIDIDVERLRYFVENFFVYQNVRYHEIGTIYECRTIDDARVDTINKNVISAMPGFNFKWIAEDDQPSFELKPDFLADQLFKKDGLLKHIIYKEDPELKT